MKETSWVGSRICRVLWGSRWWCRRWSAGVELGRSWIFHLVEDCSCLVSGKTQRIKITAGDVIMFDVENDRNINN